MTYFNLAPQQMRDLLTDGFSRTSRAKIGFLTPSFPHEYLLRKPAHRIHAIIGKPAVSEADICLFLENRSTRDSSRFMGTRAPDYRKLQLAGELIIKGRPRIAITAETGSSFDLLTDADQFLGLSDTHHRNLVAKAGCTLLTGESACQFAPRINQPPTSVYRLLVEAHQDRGVL
jgi:hypothetical protein